MRHRVNRIPAGLSFKLDLPQDDEVSTLPLSLTDGEQNALIVHMLQSPLLELGPLACHPLVNDPDADSTMFVLFHNKPLFNAPPEGLYNDSCGSVGDSVPNCSSEYLSDQDQTNVSMVSKNKNESDSNLENWCFEGNDVDLITLRVVEGTSRKMGQQGAVEIVEDSSKRRFARKIIDVSSLTLSASRSRLSSVELQGRKAGIVRELAMARSLCQKKPPCKYVVETLNATCNLEGSNQEIHIVMELMSRSLQDVQNTVAKLNRTLDSLAPVLSRDFQRSLLEHNHLRQVPIPEEIIQVVAHDVLQGLRHLHNEHMTVHGDLKPANILLSADCSCFKIGDFGCAMKLNGDTRSVSQAVDLGSRAYKAPEQLQETHFDDVKLEYNEKVDIWALGILLLELANGCHPTKLFQGKFWEYRSKLLDLDEWVHPKQGSQDFVAFIKRCLTVAPCERPSADDLLGDKFLSTVTPPEYRDQVKKYVQFIDGNVCEQMKMVDSLLKRLESPVSSSSPTFASQAVPPLTRRPRVQFFTALPPSRYATPVLRPRHHQGLGKK